MLICYYTINISLTNFVYQVIAKNVADTVLKKRLVATESFKISYLNNWHNLKKYIIFTIIKCF